MRARKRASVQQRLAAAAGWRAFRFRRRCKPCLPSPAAARPPAALRCTHLLRLLQVPLLCLQSEAEATTEKFGLEAGLWKVWSAKGPNGESKGQQVRRGGRGRAAGAGNCCLQVRGTVACLPAKPGVWGGAWGTLNQASTTDAPSSGKCRSSGSRRRSAGRQVLAPRRPPTSARPASAFPPPLCAQAKQLLARYGSAYLVTSISFAIVSMAACYMAVDSGVDVTTLLGKLGIQVSTLGPAG